MIIFGTGESLIKYKEYIPYLCTHYPTMAWGRALEFLVNECGVYPTCYSFIDPHSAVGSLELLQSKASYTTILLPHPIVTGGIDTFKMFLRKTALGRSGEHTFTYYQKQMRKATSNIGNHYRLINCTTIKRLDSIQMSRPVDWDNEPELRFSQREAICGMMDPLDFPRDERTMPMNQYENKLTMFILPICAKMGWKTIQLLGFDGVGGRYFDKSLKNDMTYRTYEAFLPRWVEWKKYHKMDICTLVPEPDCVLSKWIPYYDITQLQQSL